MADLIELLGEVEKVKLAPILMPVLKLVDPLMGSMPQGALKSMMARKGTQDGLVKTVEGLAPILPGLVRFAGHLAESKLVTGVLSLSAIMLTPLMKLLAPATSRLVAPSAGPALKLVSGLSPVLPSLIKGMDSLVRAEVSLEKGLRLAPA